MTTIILLAIAIGLNILQFVNWINYKDTQDYWKDLYDDLLEENEEEINKLTGLSELNKSNLDRITKFDTNYEETLKEFNNNIKSKLNNSDISVIRTGWTK